MLESNQVFFKILLVSFANWLDNSAVFLLVKSFYLFIIRLLTQIDSVSILVLSKFAYLSGSLLVLALIRIVTLFRLC